MDGFIIETCQNCGNRGLLKKVAQYKQDMVDYVDEEPCASIEYLWVLLECPVCNFVSLYQRYGADYMVDINGNEYYDEKIVYPSSRTFKNVPKDILISYESAVKTSKIDLSISLIAIRAVLEKICKERGTNRKKLEAMIKQMVERNVFPDTIDKCSFIIRKMGNDGAHGDNNELLSTKDVLELIDFIESILYYIYELPVKVDNFNKKYNFKLEERNSGNTVLDE